MAAPKANAYYLLAKGFKKPKSYLPNALWNRAIEYVKWVYLNPLKEEKVFSNGKRVKVNKMRAMTIAGFCIFAHISRDTFNQYEKEKEYSDVCAKIKEIIYTQKLEGAAADLLNPVIIARELGLADKNENRFTDKNGDDLAGLPIVFK
jgi:hypothetical protein